MSLLIQTNMLDFIKWTLLKIIKVFEVIVVVPMLSFHAAWPKARGCQNLHMQTTRQLTWNDAFPLGHAKRRMKSRLSRFLLTACHSVASPVPDCPGVMESSKHYASRQPFVKQNLALVIHYDLYIHFNSIDFLYSWMHKNQGRFQCKAMPSLTDSLFCFPSRLKTSLWYNTEIPQELFQQQEIVGWSNIKGFSWQMKKPSKLHLRGCNGCNVKWWALLPQFGKNVRLYSVYAFVCVSEFLDLCTSTSCLWMQIRAPTGGSQCTCQESGLQVYVLGLLTFIDHNEWGQEGMCSRKPVLSEGG